MRFPLAVAFVLCSGAAYAGQIPLLTGPQDPSQLQATVNQLITQINANAVLTSSSTPAAQGGNNNTLPATNANGSTALGGSNAANASLVVQTVTNAVDMITISGSVTGSKPIIAATGTDANIGITLSPQGTGVLQFANAASFVPTAGLSACPGYVGGGNNPVGLSPISTGFLVIQDYLGKFHWVPSC